MQLASQQIRPLLRAAYQNNQVTSLIFHDVTYTGTVDYLTDSTVYLGLTAGRSRQIPLTQITQVNLHQSRKSTYTNRNLGGTYTKPVPSSFS
ncbi:hypothetical protein FC99_GL002160 [Levilactobacillus koreensis JCM 16448]|uniref:hypothetical protein n=1 Tax=Levilactobacillus koreensis TaxID=637971 RepID=UPI0006F05E59|nr:hypothetical protein [Levilactobacillus koreensis]KRK85889.1 hypothetical protein FC99_GL002160 [Levilactobacillus koreensis JCM 16448]